MASQNTANISERAQKANMLTVSVPGLKRPIDIEFPDGQIPVCARCKKIFKTRELCRVRDKHNDIPWNTTFICLSFDDICLNLSNNGEVCLIDEEQTQRRFIARLLDEPPLPLRHKMIYEEVKHSPICARCKEKNYTKHHCRVKHEHTELPWATKYVMLSTTHNYDKTKMISHNESDDFIDTTSGARTSNFGVSSDVKLGGGTLIDDIRRVEDSRSCFLSITGTVTTLRWLEIDPTVPKTHHKRIDSFNGTPAFVTNQWFGDSIANTSTSRDQYIRTMPYPSAGLTFVKHWYENNPYNYHHYWNQRAHYQQISLPVHDKASSVTYSFSHHPLNSSDAYNCQQIEQSFINDDQRQRLPLCENRSDCYQRGCNRNTMPMLNQMNKGLCGNDQYFNSWVQQEVEGAPWSCMPMKEDFDKSQGHLRSVNQYHGSISPVPIHHSKQNTHSNDLEMSNQDLYPRENY